MHQPQHIQNYLLIMVLTTAAIFQGCSTYTTPLKTVDDLDLEKYSGKWYEISRLPNRFENDLKCVTATYEIKENGKIRVINRGRKIDDPSKVKESKGTAWVPDSSQPAQLKVRFFWPFAGDYYVMRLHSDYEYALVGDPTRKYLWILSRTPEMDKRTVQNLKAIASERGFDTSRMIDTVQDCN